ncbi:MAG TPA: 5'/3'-nucleotidase SurE [Candidatus Bathyarchaeia archaeon]|nr:5'/3'-nucleotidase SurE [Candidatus Bathyarchaeia archaeon]
MKTILLINDDGIYASGLLAIKKKLAHLGKIVAVTPKEEISGIGKAITSTRHVQIEEVKLSDDSKAYGVIGGTPADAYLLAVNKILKSPPDVVVAGINLGPNLGIDDFLNSGTIGAALEAAIHNIPAVAISYCKREIDDQKADKSKITLAELELAASVGQKIVEHVLEKGMPPNVDLISVNVPENADCTRLKVTKLSYEGYGDLFTKEEKGYRIAQWRLADYGDSDPETDVHVVQSEGCISIMPVRIRFQHNMTAMEKAVKQIF